MGNPNYAKGADYERALVKNFMIKGALYATRTPGSRSPIDVIAIFPALVHPLHHPRIHVVQCKVGKSQPKRSEIDFLKFMREKGCDAYFVTMQKASRPKKNQDTFHRVTLEEVEAGALGSIKDDGLSDTQTRANETKRGNNPPTRKRHVELTGGDLGASIPVHKLRHRR